jgi:hypothetical protein
MTISSNTATASYAGNGVTQVFPVPFYFLADKDLKVSKKVAATGVVSVLTLNSDYTVSDAGNQAGGSITTLAVPASGDQLFIERNVDAVQETAYPANSPFPAASHEKALDRLTMLVQQLLTGLGFKLGKNALSTTYDVGGNTISNAADAVNATDLTTQQQVDSKIAAAATGIPPTDIALYSHLASTATGKGAALLGWPSGYGINQASTGQYWAQNGAGIHRLNDRLFLGGATASSGSYPQTTDDWLSAYYNSIGYSGSSAAGMLNVQTNPSDSSAAAAAFGARTQFFTGAGASCFGVTSVSVNDHPTLATNSWTFYGEAHKETSASGCIYAMELDTRTTAPSGGVPNPYQQGSVVALQLASGAGVGSSRLVGSISGTTLTVTSASPAVGYQIAVGSLIYGVGVAAGTKVTALGTGTGGTGTYTVNNSQTVGSEELVATNQYDASAAIQIESNALKFQAGIVFGSDSITGADGVGGSGIAIAMGKGHTLQWYAGANTLTGRINCQGTTSVNSVQMQFNDGAMYLQSRTTGAVQHGFYVNDSAVNALYYGPSATGQPVYIQASGSDTNIDLKLVPKGTGRLQLGYNVSSAVTPSAFSAQKLLAIKDGTGTTYYIPCATTGW